MARKLTDHEQRLFAEALIIAEAQDSELLDQDAIARLLNPKVHRASGALGIDWHHWTTDNRQEDPTL